ncbi:serine hydrolase [Viridibacterium curvum]|uniref:D-alanyl-D-alanine endopeptidase n=1 Tax=Viridibacterium curvum TaxID=1101404 RepID=A0ABP9QF38_9RHOO
MVFRSLFRIACLALATALVIPATADAATARTKSRDARAQKLSVTKTSVTKASSLKSSRLAPRASKAVAKTSPAASRAKARKVTLRELRSEPEFDPEGNPLLRSSAFVVQDIETGRVLLERNASMVQPIASISKLMTAMVVLDANLRLDEVIEISDDDIDRLKGTSSHLPVGTRLTREDLLRLALMASENRAASALGRAYPGGLPAFIEAMNHKAASLNLQETRFFDSSGLNKNNVASARDLVGMTAAASHYPLIREFSTLPEYSFLIKGRLRAFHNTNALVRDSDWQIDLQKTGYISESGKCLVMRAMLNNRPTAIVLLDSWGRYTRVADANRIRKWVEKMVEPARIAHGPVSGQL